jgi:hypothetical protein
MYSDEHKCDGFIWLRARPGEPGYNLSGSKEGSGAF